jgi:hypothetical protein
MSMGCIEELENLIWGKMIVFLPHLRIKKEVLTPELTAISQYLIELICLLDGEKYLPRSLVDKLFRLYTTLQAESGYLSDKESARCDELIIKVLNEIRDIMSVEKRYMM